MPNEVKVLFSTIIIVIVVFSLVGMFSEQLIPPTDLKPGNAIFVLTGNTVIQEGKPCQENKAGFISPTSPNGSNNWALPERLFWPTSQDYSVILMDGTIKWQNEYIVVKSPADPKLLLCPTPAK